MGKPLAMCSPRDHDGDQDAILSSVAAAKSIRNKETVRLAKSCERIEVMITAFPLRDASGTIVRSAAIMDDITPRKQLGRQLAQAQKLESIQQLAAGIAHEID